jgi:hypothetical protein
MQKGMLVKRISWSLFGLFAIDIFFSGEKGISKAQARRP